MKYFAKSIYLFKSFVLDPGAIMLSHNFTLPKYNLMLFFWHLKMKLSRINQNWNKGFISDFKCQEDISLCYIFRSMIDLLSSIVI